MFDNATFKKAYQEDVQMLTINPLIPPFFKVGDFRPQNNALDWE